MTDQQEPMFILRLLTLPHVAELETAGNSIEELTERFRSKSEVIRTFYRNVLLDVTSVQTEIRTLTLPASGDTPQSAPPPPTAPALSAPPLDGNESVEGAEPGQDGKPVRRRRTKVEMEAARAAEAAAAAPPIANAPAPMPIPGATSPTPPPPPLVGAPAPSIVSGLQPPAFVTAPNQNGIPQFLDRTGAATVAAPPPPPPPPPPPLPPVCNLGHKIAEKLKVHGENQQWLTWIIENTVRLDSDGKPAVGPDGKPKYVIQPGSTWDEVLSVLHFIADDKLGAVAAALGVSAA